MTHRVVFSPEALEQIADLYQYIASEASPGIALRYTEAIVSYCESLRGELRGSGVSVVTLLPGYVDTPLTRENRYAMPFLLSPETFADRAFDAIVGGVSYRVIPWQMGVVAKLLRLLPNAWFDRLLQGRPRKHRRGEGRSAGT